MVSTTREAVQDDPKYLLEGFVVDEACCILGNVQLTFLEMLSELPAHQTGSKRQDLTRTQVMEGNAL